MAEIAPEVLAMDMEQDRVHKHKDVLAHSIQVTARAEADLTLRLTTLFHDIGKPATRRFNSDGVTFRHHEAVGAKITQKRLKALGYSPQMVSDVTELVRLSGRFKGYTDGWSDSAVRRYVKEAGGRLELLNKLVRADCTTKNPRKEADLQLAVDDLEKRIDEIAAADAKAAERPQLNGHQIMTHLDVKGPVVGEAVAYLLEVKREEGELPETEVYKRLDAWYEQR